MTSILEQRRKGKKVCWKMFFSKFNAREERKITDEREMLCMVVERKNPSFVLVASYKVVVTL
jgi:hypothetical protein